jgi:S-layer protein (TIGR01567 family)
MKKYTATLLAALTVFIAVASGTASAADNVSNGTTICNVVGTHYECANWSGEQYPVIDLFGDEYVSLFAKDDDIWDSHVNKLAKLILDSNETHTLKPGENIDLGHGYALEVKEIDIETEKAWLEFTRDGQQVATKTVSIDTDDNRTWTVALDSFQGENDVVVMKVHIKQLFVGTETSIIWIDGIWLIDYANARTLDIGDEFGEFTLKQIINGVDASNPGSLVFENTSVADDSKTSNSSASPSPEKGMVKFADKSTGSSTPWYRDFWGWITMKSK